MKWNSLRICVFIVVLAFLFSGLSHAKKWTVKVKDYSFFPYNLTHVRAHDTIQWVWESGVHSTTSTSIPPDAMDWDFPVDQANPVFIYIPTVNGTYFYQSTPDTAKEMNGHFVVSGASGLSGELPEGFRVFPNPASEMIFFELPSDFTGQVSLDVYNSQGQDVGHLQVIPGSKPEIIQYNLGILPRGVYFFKLSSSGKKVYLQRVVRN